ncbi:MAG: hypothetical protein ABIQ95_05160, partial [Bdellovibrionia bacterium]
MNTPLESKIDAQAKALFSSTYNSLCVDNDRIFSLVLVLQWFACILIAIFVSPRTWLADMGTVHVHVWTAIVLGGLLSALPIYLNLRAPGKVINRYVNVIAQAFYSALFIHLTGGRIEAHFHVFASLAGFALYRDYRVLLAGTAIVAGDHAIRGIFFPQSAFGVFNTSEWRWMEHAAWVLFEDFFLGYACLRALSEMKVVARKTAEVMAQKDLIEYEVQKRTFELHESRNSVKLLLDNAGQGFFHFNREGKIGVECSKAVEKLFQVNPARMNISDLITSQSQVDWKEQVDLLFNSPMPFSQLKEI